jgi:uncharacterized protein YbjT (DUF2867 family)
MRRLLVTGALGNVGREVVAACAGAPDLTLRTTARRSQEALEHHPQHESVELDFTRRETWAPALVDCDYVFLMRPPPIGDMDATLKPFVDLAYQCGVEHIVFLSVARADQMKWVPHRKVELHLMERHGKAWTLLRPGFFAQNLQDAYRLDIVEDNRLYVPAGNGRVAFLDVRDAAEVAGLIFREPARFSGEALTLTGPEALTFDDVTSVLSTELGRSIRYQAASIPGYAWHLKSRRRLGWMQTVVQTFLHVGLRKGDAETVDPTIGRLLGKPARTLSDYVRQRAAIWR